MKDGEHYSAIKSGNNNEKDFLIYSFATGEVTDTIVLGKDIIPSDSAHAILPSDYQLSTDETRVLFQTAKEKIYRRSSRASFYVYNLKTKTADALSEEGKQQAADFSPDGNRVAFVRNNNLFYKDLLSGKEVQVTSDGKKNNIINGITDWVYEEEFEFVKAFEWSPDGKYLAYYRFDETDVPEYTIQFFKGLYPENYTYKYPKVGEKNAVVSVFVYELSSKTSKKIDLGSETNQYIPRIKWTQNSDLLCVFRMNRWQNRLDLLLADASDGKTRVMFTEENDRYIDIHDDLTFFNTNKNFIWTSEINGYNHIYIGNVNDGKLKQITEGSWDITSFYGIDEKSRKIFYQSAESSPLERYVYEISFDGKNKRQLTPDHGWNDAVFNISHTYMMVTHSDANSPEDFKLYGKRGELIRVLEDNKALKEKLNNYPLTKKEFFSFATSEGIQLNGWMIKPWNFNPNNKYPVFMTEYGGPGSQEVTDQWTSSTYLFHQYLAQEGYLIACIDNRGTGGRGEEFKKMTYLQLGKYEPLDQIEGAKYLGSLPFIDKNRIGIFGWSYGGYLSALCIELGPGIFKAAISVAPVTDWRFYDTIYTERYMRDNKENEKGYVEGSPVTYADRIKGNFLLVSGLADDNVHYQNMAVFLKKLYENNVAFDQMTFPDKNHSIAGGNTRYYLFTQIAEWIKENL
ncbi:MAG: S9 family peptidase [Chitinophagales bacterium]|nr:S9 family peptidase [Chitinophagales bacterium]